MNLLSFSVFKHIFLFRSMERMMTSFGFWYYASRKRARVVDRACLENR